MKVGHELRYNRDMVTVNKNPIAIKFIVIDLPADDEFLDTYMGPSPAEVHAACVEVRSAVNRWLYDQAADRVVPSWARAQ